MKILSDNIVLLEYFGSAFGGIAIGVILGRIYIRCATYAQYIGTTKGKKNNARRKEGTNDV